ncbi:MAG: polyphosphate polymerase domain-containing protein [Clostridium sp.]|uniref:polyphosphate polymerase domain-containing protein n=1 Tax=Clostridium sp. DSM 8431 TaxID=1761781 RepID=UPI0008E4F059|nr:polyphosphate polymerase domain-containing protein [Clostridium sp. DSM 8431]MCR4943723.1 polyphosphate polymerase domain-containing protein [Clostridium sp.]SFU48841.1 VTC domain-containing protein [Clostridium sp. DSM 8431]
MAIKSFKRYEKKFILTKEQYDKFIPRILEFMEPDKHCRNGRNYNIYNIYYDTNNNDVIRHSISKPYYKEKLRLRSYKIPTSLDDEVFLELKKKINGIVTKRRVVITLGQAYEFLETRKRPENIDYVTKQIFNELEYYLSNNTVYPKVYISYSRNAFFAKDNKDFRLTFDNSIQVRREKLSLEAGSFGRDLLGPEKFLMEVKILGAMPLWFSNILSDLSIYTTHFSKYGNEFMDYCKENKKYGRKEAC